ncbi:MAG: DUF2442 domain-containing protein [Ignavibacteriales bacterium]|nr:DUF2442 domain-containing protein [Ignavibacteriales bacterium]
MYNIVSVTPLENFRVRLGLSNEKNKIVDLEPFLRGPIFEPLRNDLKLFRSVYVDEELETIAWSNGADIDPDVLLENLTPAWMEQKQETVYTEKSSRALAVQEKSVTYGMKKLKK